MITTEQLKNSNVVEDRAKYISVLKGAIEMGENLIKTYVEDGIEINPKIVVNVMRMRDDLKNYNPYPKIKKYSAPTVAEEILVQAEEQGIF